MYKTDFKETTTIINAGSPEECEQLLRQNREAVERLKNESANPAFSKSNNNNNNNNNNYTSNNNYSSQQQYAPSRGRNMGNSNHHDNTDEILKELKETNSRIREVSQELINLNESMRNSQVGRSSNHQSLNASNNGFNNQRSNNDGFKLNFSNTGSNNNSFNSKNNNNYNNNTDNNGDLSESYKRTFVKCEGIEYEEYQDDLDRSKDFKAMRKGPYDEWKQIQSVPSQIQPILEAKQRIERTVEEEKQKAEQSSFMKSRNNNNNNSAHRSMQSSSVYKLHS